ISTLHPLSLHDALPISKPSTTTPNYKSYNGTLIHPLLQPDPISTVKPTTPLPSLDLLSPGQPLKTEVTQAEIQETSRRIEQQLRSEEHTSELQSRFDIV